MTLNNEYNIKHTVEKNLYPYLSFSIMAIIVQFIANYLTSGRISLTINNLLLNSYKTISLFGIGAIWFIPSYLIGYTAFTKSIIKNAKIRVLPIVIYLALSICISPILEVEKSNLNSRFLFSALYYPILSLVRGLACSIFIVLGYILSVISRKLSRSIIFTFGMICFPISFFISLECGESNFSFLQLGNNALFFYLSSILGSIGLISCICFIYEFLVIRFLEYCGRNSLILMGTHMSLLLPNICGRIVNSLIGNYLNEILKGIISLGFMLAIESVIIFFINGKFKWLLNWKLIKYKQE